ncbi:MAG: xanthine dehydrogenase FAD-binding subunit XdhB [Eubacteriales bacterium]|nr:xanthine dehydrogenase FAD-binding subunit XdhB [Eubacteriales bacterium]
MFDIKALYEAQSISDAVRLLEEHPKARILAGGSDVLIKIREGRMAGCELVSIYGLDELRGVSLDDTDALRVGPLTSFSALENDPLIRQYICVLGQAAGTVGGPQVRNIGTVGGNVCNGVPSADTASTLLAWDAQLELTGPGGMRRSTVEEFYLGPGRTDVRPGELLTCIVFPRESYENYFGWYIKYSMRNAMDIATLGCSVNVKLSADGKHLEDVRAAYGVAAPTPIRAKKAEEAFRGAEITPELPKLFAEAIQADICPRTSWRAPEDFRRHIAGELTMRALQECIRLAGERSTK